MIAEEDACLRARGAIARVLYFYGIPVSDRRVLGRGNGSKLGSLRIIRTKDIA